MTPTEIETAARNKYAAVSDTFFTQAEILIYMTEACTELAKEFYCVERTYSTVSVQGTQEYAFPTNTIAIKRITYNGSKVYPISFREDDAITLSNSTTTQQGTPIYYTQFASTIAFRPIPDTSARTIKIYSFSLPTDLTNVSVLEVPTMFHHQIPDYIVAQMAAKDENFKSATYFLSRWEKNLIKGKILWRKLKRADSFATIQDENTLPTTIIGAV